MKTTMAVSAALFAALVVPAAAWAQCAGGAEMVPTLGIALVECDCTVGSADANAWNFRTPPKVMSIARGSAAEGVLQEGDVILQVGGRAITTAEGGAAFARARTAGSTQLLIQRNGRTQHVTLRPTEMCPAMARTIAAAPGTVARAGGRSMMPVPAPSAATVQGAPVVPGSPPLIASTVVGAQATPVAPGVSTWIGIAFSCRDCTVDRDNGRWNFRTAPEVYSVESGSPAHSAGLRRGDVLTHVDGVAITTTEGGRRWAQVKPGQTVRVSYQRAGGQRTASIRAGDPRQAVTAAGVSTFAYRASVDSSAQAVLRSYANVVQQQQAREEMVLRRLLERQASTATDSSSKRQMEAVLQEYLQYQAQNKLERQEFTQEMLRSLERSAIVRDVRPSVVPLTTAAAAEQRLRFSGSIGGADVEVRGQSSVVVSERQDELVITTSDATIRIKVPRRD